MKTIFFLAISWITFSAYAQTFPCFAGAIGLVDTMGDEPYQRPFFRAGISAADFKGDDWDNPSLATGIEKPPFFYLNNGDGTQRLTGDTEGFCHE